jgi:predicted S18 family serine protease
MSWNKVDDRESDERIEHESEEVREAKAKGVTVEVEGVEWKLQASEKNNAEVMAKPKKSKPKADMVNHPPHYTSHPSGVECIQITEHMGFNLGNALKYIWRADLKGSAVEDLEKAIFYINRELEKRKSK